MSNNLYKLDGASWKKVSKRADQFLTVVAGVDSVFALRHRDHSIWQFPISGGSEFRIGNGAHIATVHGRLLCFNAFSGDVYEYGGDPHNWIRVATKIDKRSDIVGSGSTIFLLNPGGATGPLPKIKSEKSSADPICLPSPKKAQDLDTPLPIVEINQAEKYISLFVSKMGLREAESVSFSVRAYPETGIC